MNNIPIFFTCDDNYLPFLSVTLLSMKKNASKNYIYDIKILNTGILEENKKIIKNYTDDNFKIEFIDISDKIQHIKGKLHTRDYYTPTTYFRLFIPNMYPNIDKCLYLDSDIIIKGDISQLYNFDIKDNLLGGIPDEIVNKTDEFKKYTLMRLGIDCSHYVNAGIIIMNLKKMREIDFENEFLNTLERVKFTVAQDQDYINYICKNKIFYLPKSWNKQPLPDEISEDEINLIHYNLNLKPWHYDNIMYENYFWEYAKQSEYFEEIKAKKQNYSDEKKQKDFSDGENLKKLALYEAEILGVI